MISLTRFNSCTFGTSRFAPMGRRMIVPLAKKGSAEVPGLLNEDDITKMAQEILMEDPEMREKLSSWTNAMQQVDKAKLAASKLESEIEELEKEAASDARLGERERKRLAAERMADAEVAAAEKLLMAAEIESSRAEIAREQLKSAINADAGRVESGKAAAAAVVGGLFAALPWFLLGGEDPSTSGLTGALSLLSVLAESAIFGVTYRYAVASDPASSHLKSGAVTAFALVRAGAVADLLQQTSASGSFSIEEVIGPAALYAGQSVLIFGFAAAAIEAAMTKGFISRVDGK